MVFGLFLVISLVIGFIPAYTGRNNKSLESYLMADRNMNVIPVGLSLFVTMCTTVPLLTGPVEVYNFGIAYWGLIPGSLLAFLVVAHLCAPIFHRLQLVSTYEVSNSWHEKNLVLEKVLVFAVSCASFKFLPINFWFKCIMTHFFLELNVNLLCCSLYSSYQIYRIIMKTPDYQNPTNSYRLTINKQFDNITKNTCENILRF